MRMRQQYRPEGLCHSHWYCCLAGLEEKEGGTVKVVVMAVTVEVRVQAAVKGGMVAEGRLF